MKYIIGPASLSIVEIKKTRKGAHLSNSPHFTS